jgi:hypothetical protein
MTFTKGDKLTLIVDGIHHAYTVYSEGRYNGIDKLQCLDDEGCFVLLTKATVIRRIGESWIYKPVTTLPEELFTL